MDWFASELLGWFDVHGRRDLPWQRDLAPYRVWVSEIMLQQTQVSTVIPFFERFMDRFPEVERLAAAPLDEVLHLWTGLGYYARARNLHKAARIVVDDFGGQFPDDPVALEALPGIGRSTAGAIAAVAFGRRSAILDGNVKRVLARFHAVAGHPGRTDVAERLWTLAESHTPAVRVGDYTQAIMDLGATLCTRARPRCAQCPMVQRCAAHVADDVRSYPAPRPRKVLPVRTARMFLVQDPTGRCLLERRPPTGIWGGLWNPPERAAATPAAALLEELGLPQSLLVAELPGASFRHTFTHFHLDIEPVFVRLGDGVGAVADRPGVDWFDLATPPAVGLSAPAAKLLAGLSPIPEEPDHDPDGVLP